MPPAFRHGFLRDLSIAQEAVRGGNVSHKRTIKEYEIWRSFCADIGVDHFMDDPSLPVVEILQVYGVRVRDRRFTERPGDVKAESVAAAWLAVATTHLLEGRPDPRKPPGMGGRELDKRLSRQLKYYSNLDPPPRREKPVPLGLVVAAAKGSRSTPRDRCLGDLIQIALYFCLRSCEYTKVQSHVRTTQFRMRDVQFHDVGGVLPYNSPAAEIRRALAVTLFLDNQKNGVRADSITMEASGVPFGCAVGGAASRFLHLRAHGADLDTPLCTYYDRLGGGGVHQR